MTMALEVAGQALTFYHQNVELWLHLNCPAISTTLVEPVLAKHAVWEAHRAMVKKAIPATNELIIAEAAKTRRALQVRHKDTHPRHRLRYDVESCVWGKLCRICPAPS
jgi:hypothetical protein